MTEEERISRAVAAPPLMTVKLVAAPMGEREDDFDVIIGGKADPTPLEIAMRLSAIIEATSQALAAITRANPTIAAQLEAPSKKDMN